MRRFSRRHFLTGGATVAAIVAAGCSGEHTEGGPGVTEHTTASRALSPAHPLLDTALGWWDARTGLNERGDLPDLSGNGNDMVLRSGAAGDPVVLPFERESYLWMPGWEDEWVDTPLTVPTEGFEVRFDHDIEFEPLGRPAEWATIIHQGDKDDFTFAVTRLSYVDTYGPEDRVGFIYSFDGMTIEAQFADAVHASLKGRAHFGIRFDALAGELRFYEQIWAEDDPIPDLTLDFGTLPWEEVRQPVVFSPRSLHQSELKLSISGFDAPVTGVDGPAPTFGAYYRLIVSQLDGTIVADLDPSIVELPLSPWTEVSGYPLVGTVDTANEAAFPGGAGETWTQHVFQTYSYPCVFVDRAYVVTGNGSYLEAPEPIDDGSTSDLTFMVAALNYHDTDISGTDKLLEFGGMGVGMGPSATLGFTLGVPSATVSDGTTTVSAILADPPPRGEVSVWVGRFDRSSDSLRAFLPPARSSHEVDTSAVGSIARSKLGSLVLSGMKTPTRTSECQLGIVGAAIWTRALTNDEILNVLPYELGLTDSPVTDSPISTT